jgi:hypothetical protein
MLRWKVTMKNRPKYQSNWSMKYYDLFYLVVNLKSLPYFSTFISHNSGTVFYSFVYFIAVQKSSFWCLLSWVILHQIPFCFVVLFSVKTSLCTEWYSGYTGAVSESWEILSKSCPQDKPQVRSVRVIAKTTIFELLRSNIIYMSLSVCAALCQTPSSQCSTIPGKKRFCSMHEIIYNI